MSKAEEGYDENQETVEFVILAICSIKLSSWKRNGRFLPSRPNSRKQKSSQTGI